MNEKYLKLKIETIINKILYKKNIINKNMYEEISMKLDKLIFKEIKKWFYLKS